MSEKLGLRWIADHTGIASAQPFAVESCIGSMRKTIVQNIVRQEIYSAAARPEPTIPAHLTFAFKHEVVHLEFLARLFAAIDPKVLVNWISAEPTGGYARRAGFFFEWLTGKILDVPDTPAGNYIEALDPNQYLVASRAVNVPRWRVRDNLPGTRDFCPTVVRNDAIRKLEQYNCREALNRLEVEFGADIILRSAVWLTIKESKASFAIEHEEKQVDRIRRFAAVMERRAGEEGDPLEIEALTTLQTEILGAATRYGVRRSPVFLGHTSGYTDVVDYIAPHWDQTPSLLAGLRTSLARTKGASSLIRAAVASFGFVYIHPMADGNGRISRFLVNDVLRRDGAVPAPFILPISATITDSTQERAGYDRALERFSRPLMRKFGNQYHFGAEYECEDGVRTNFSFDAYDEALAAWRYPELTSHSDYIGNVVRLTIEREMSKEAAHLRAFERAREAVKNHLEGPNTDIDRIIRSLQKDSWVVSNKLIKEFSPLADPARAKAIADAVREVFEPPSAEADEDDVEFPASKP